MRTKAEIYAKSRDRRIALNEVPGSLPRKLAVSTRNKLKNYGLSEEEYWAIHESQNGLCKICGCKNTVKYRGKYGYTNRLVLDHDHKTGKFRGLICHSCNCALGLLDDDPEWHQQLADYILKVPKPYDCLTFIPHIRQPKQGDSDYSRYKGLLEHYDIDKAQWTALYNYQGGVCAVCGKPETHLIGGKPISLSVDHDHESGAVRALLCWRCNSALAHYRESVAYIQSAIAYIVAHRLTTEEETDGEDD